MARRLDWDRATERAKLRQPDRQPPPITDAQAALLQKLQRQLGEPYCGEGLTVDIASQAIDDCLRRLRQRGARLGRR